MEALRAGLEVSTAPHAGGEGGGKRADSPTGASPQHAQLSRVVLEEQSGGADDAATAGASSTSPTGPRRITSPLHVRTLRPGASDRTVVEAQLARRAVSRTPSPLAGKSRAKVVSPGSGGGDSGSAAAGSPSSGSSSLYSPHASSPLARPSSGAPAPQSDGKHAEDDAGGSDGKETEAGASSGGHK